MKITFLSPDLISPYLPKYFSGPLGWVEGAISRVDPPLPLPWLREENDVATISLDFCCTTRCDNASRPLKIWQGGPKTAHFTLLMQLLKMKCDTFYQNVVKVPERLRIKLRLQFCASVECFLQIGSISSVSKLENFDFSVLYKCIAQKNQNSQRAAVSRPWTSAFRCRLNCL